MAPNLPGYYYDEDKGKYFKIVPDSASVTRSKYSTTAVAEAKKQKHDLAGEALKSSQELEKREEHQKRRLRHQIQRSVILSLDALGGELGGHEGRVQSAAAEIWAKGLGKNDFIQWPHPLRSGDPRSIRHFIRDSATGAIAYAMDYPGHRSCFANVPNPLIAMAIRVCIPVPDPLQDPNSVARLRMEHAKPLGLHPDSEVGHESFIDERH
ncbi:MAG: hypothetical protein L6R40_003896 [Gallowayella cf. fulva]|nr:MAG: hypothetical protein L6R40_003896 [Xanthomendoza cf. fulva]